MAIARGWGLPLQGALAATCLLSAPVALCSDTWFVAGDGDDTHDCLAPATPCATIQGAIAKAASGDSILVRAETFLGTGNEVVLVDRDLELSGGWNQGFTLQTGSTIVDGENTRTGILIEATASVERFVVQHGVPGPASAGGVSNYGILTLTRCTVQQNQGGGVRNEGTLVVDASTISGNSNNSGAGGIVNFFFSSLTLSNSTVSGNHSTSEGGGLSVGAGTVSLNSTTVTGNSADFGGGGVRNRTGGTLELQNSVIAGNTAPFGPDCWDPTVGTFVSKGYNLIGDPTLCDFTPGPGDLFRVAHGLGPLLDNGGPTRTHRPELGSAVIDAGNPGGCTDANGTLLVADQRDVARPQGSRCDIGAVEYVSATDFYTVTPCRLVDTRDPMGPSGGPALLADTTRSFPVTGLCEIPSTARAVAVNLAVVGANAAGHLRLFPVGTAVPDSSTINFVTGVTRANNAVIPVSSGGQIAVYCRMASPLGQTHFILDVVGYFQ